MSKRPMIDAHPGDDSVRPSPNTVSQLRLDDVGLPSSPHCPPSRLHRLHQDYSYVPSKLRRPYIDMLATFDCMMLNHHTNMAYWSNRSGPYHSVGNSCQNLRLLDSNTSNPFCWRVSFYLCWRFVFSFYLSFSPHALFSKTNFHYIFSLSVVRQISNNNFSLFCNRLKIHINTFNSEQSIILIWIDFIWFQPKLSLARTLDSTWKWSTRTRRRNHEEIKEEKKNHRIILRKVSCT